MDPPGAREVAATRADCGRDGSRDQQSAAEATTATATVRSVGGGTMVGGPRPDAIFDGSPR
ncbi:hypothetical protein GCM10009774_26700 [Cellulomonas gelida]|uniref:Uncharacterized protein n=1 Tax=Cellulomonas gelida TaxID=1712 RepID=A0A4Y3KFZ1_9CELL|nr:hypothetical protein CGE01nite_01330 [Cellulomonas gelida]GGL34786.1 hypothetical protein GCM10009774_26700 [Cellulomonas gelida]